MWLIVAIGYAVLSAGICSHLARQKGYLTSQWSTLGFLFGIFAIGALLMKPPGPLSHYDNNMPRRGTAPGRAKGKKRIP